MLDNCAISSLFAKIDNLQGKLLYGHRHSFRLVCVFVKFPRFYDMKNTLNVDQTVVLIESVPRFKVTVWEET